MPCMGRIALDDVRPIDVGAADVGPDDARPAGGGAVLGTPSLAVVGELNDAAYGQRDRLGRLIGAIDDPRVRAHGLRVDGEWACVALTLRVDDDISVQYVATGTPLPPRARRTGHHRSHARGATGDGARTATLQAGPDGYGVYERLGFRTVGTLHASIAQAAA